MSGREQGNRCRETTGVVVKAFASLLEEQAVDGQVAVDKIRRMCLAIGGTDGLLADFYSTSERSCLSTFALRQVDAQRTNYIGRIVTKTFAHVLDDRASGLSRRHLGQFFTALRMILGEEGYDDIQSHCAAVAADLASPDGVTRWDLFYAHAEIARMRERILISIARIFRRFEPRKDWLLIIMNSSPNSRSTASTAFVLKKAADRTALDFGEAKFVTLFEALFAGVDPKAMSDDEAAAFQGRWGVTPETMFGPLFKDLSRMKIRLLA